MIDRDPGKAGDAQFGVPAPGGGHARPRRLSGTLLRAGAVAVFACGTLAACGDDGGDAATGDEGGVASVEDFCASMERINVQLDSRGYFESEGREAAPAHEAVKDIDPPEEIKSQWATLLEGTETAVELERNDSGRFEKTPESEKAADRILSYVDVQCSIDLSS
ncbi:hypothetical protein [Actinomadura sp. 7K507]|uniref:hypothetical protein n=1 Tax=Actinomadura sp. 7K507 TaxID=2530365 RepID=UPI001051F836|nr:hypothetical protein [Actinomadura sp. 7K507]TDC86027.1 hypothetical protein E1285_24255 [Actinomadura sp. 7K507]